MMLDLFVSAKLVRVTGRLPGDAKHTASPPVTTAMITVGEGSSALVHKGLGEVHVLADDVAGGSQLHHLEQAHQQDLAVHRVQLRPHPLHMWPGTPASASPGARV